VNGKDHTVPSSPLRLLNFGCGSALHPEWVNLDSSAAAPGVVAHDLRHGLPFPLDSFEAAYGSHVLEHLEPDAASRLLRECHRILRPDGILRIVVPDLEAIARLYLDSLDRAAAGDTEAAFRYDWMMLELYDQTVRTKSGGCMGARFLDKLEEYQVRFIEARIGAEAMCLAVDAPADRRPALWRALRRLRAVAAALRRCAAEACLLLVLGREGASALRTGLFRQSGEAHQWMYDRFSLRRAMAQAGFGEIRICVADESGIPGFARFGLETRNHHPRRPDSLYMEGKKPAPP
jgi:predicted SAM-dependent methyltransferase